MASQQLKCIIIEDDEAACLLLRELVKGEEDITALAYFSEGIAGFKYLKEHPVDILFLDVELPDLTGLELLSSLENPPQVIITSGQPTYALESFRYNVTDYLLKPLKPLQFQQAIERARKAIATKQAPMPEVTEEERFLFVKVERQYQRLDLDDIQYAEASGNHVMVSMPKKQVKVFGKISDLEQKLPAGRFMRVHRSYILNLASVDVLQGSVAVVGNKAIPISRDLVETLENRLNILK